MFGLPENLPVSELPIYNDVMKHYSLIKYELEPNKTTKKPTNHYISERFAQEIL